MAGYGALVISLALAMATWVRHFAVALGVTVGLYVLVTAGPVLLLLASYSRSMEGFASLSPWYGVGETTFAVGDPNFVAHTGWKVMWLVAYAAAALAIWAATERTFDRCLGRAGGPRERPYLRGAPHRRSIAMANRAP
jgi:hypothetical protein